MSTVPLPENPSLERLRNEARQLQRSVRAGTPDGLAFVAEHHPGGGSAAADRPRFRLTAAQLAVARSYGFASWPALKRHLDVVERFTWNPAASPDAVVEDLADRLCRLACLSYDGDEPGRWAGARELLSSRPELSTATIWAAAATGDSGAVERWLARDRSLVTTRGGPFGWCPLFYLAYSRLDPSIPAGRVLRTARALLDAGADPNEGYLWHGLPTPFTLLTGAFGHGELGPERQPPHPHSIALARLLLAAGADPNDGQGLYNRMFEPEDNHLRLLFEHGLGRGDGGPWKARLGDHLDGPSDLVRSQLAWAVSHDQPNRVRLLVEHGVDLTTRDPEGRTPAEIAAVTGNREIADYLLAHGAPPLRLDGVDALAAAIMASDRAATRRVDADLIHELRRRQPWLIVWAAARHRLDGVRLLLELGWDVDAFGRQDTACGDVSVSEEFPCRWETALHTAAGTGDVPLIRLLLAAGANPDVRDKRFGTTPLSWARYGKQPGAIDLLAPVTAAEEPGS